MSILSYLACGAVLVFVAWPLFRPQSAGIQHDGSDASASPLERQKLDAYAAIKEADLDRRMGKLSDDDFADLTQRYRRQALAAIAALDKSRRHAADAVPAEPDRPRTPVAFCPACGHRASPDANFCTTCGRSFCDATA